MTERLHIMFLKTQSTTYYNKYGNKKVYNINTRVNKEASLSELVDQFDSICFKYLDHRFSVSNEKYYWKFFCLNTHFHTVWMDYSVNIEFTEKNPGSVSTLFGSKHVIVR